MPIPLLGRLATKKLNSAMDQRVPPVTSPNAPNSGVLANTNPIAPRNDTARMAQGGVSRLATLAPTAAGQPQGYKPPQQQVAPTPPAATNEGLGQQVTNAYSLLTGGNNPAADQADRTATSSLSNLQKATDADFNRTAAMSGFVPGTAAYAAARQRASAPVLSQGSNILATLAQKRLDDQARNLQAAGSYSQSGQRLASDLTQRGVDNAFRTDRATVADSQWNQTFGANEDQRGKDNSYRDLTWGASEDQRGKDNAYRTDRAETSDSQWDSTFGATENQRGIDNAYRDLLMINNEDQRGKDNAYRDNRATVSDSQWDSTFGANEDQRGKDNSYRDNRATASDQQARIGNYTGLLATDLLSAGQAGDVKNAIASELGLNNSNGQPTGQGQGGGQTSGWGAPDPSAPQQALNEQAAYYVALGYSPEEALKMARQNMIDTNPYAAEVKAAKEAEAAANAGPGKEWYSPVSEDPMKSLFDPQGDWASDDTVSQVRTGFDNMGEGNVITGAQQVLGAGANAVPAAGRDLTHATLNAGRKVVDWLGW